MQRTARALALGLALCAAPGCARVLYNFGEIAPGRIYRSAQPSPLFLRWLTQNHGIRTLINLRGETPGFESHYAARHGLRLISFDLSATAPPSQADVARFLQVVSDPENQPVLVHCRAGVDRTGYMLALYRIEREGWTAERALHEMNRFLQFEPLNAVPHAVVRDGLRQSD
jgi:protein tyrosine/serine phosphatase